MGPPSLMSYLLLRPDIDQQIIVISRCHLHFLSHTHRHTAVISPPSSQARLIDFKSDFVL